MIASRSTVDPPADEHSVRLARFQQEGVARAAAIMRERGGVLIADSVGLGKTFIALALIEIACRNNEAVLLVVPAALRSTWRRELTRLALDLDRVQLVSHTALALGRCAITPAQLVVVDEAHAFRNPATARYRALQHACRGARILLLTATPVNNSLSDLYFQLRLFAGDGAFRDIGIASLRLTLLKRSASDSDLDKLRRAVMVRRTRADVRAAAIAEGFHFPERVVTQAVRYQLPLSMSQTSDFLGQLTFPGYSLDGEKPFTADLLRLAFLKRMESSVQALRITLRRQLLFYDELSAALQRGFVLRPRVFRSLFELEGDSLQLVLDSVTLERLRGSYEGFLPRVHAEAATLRRIIGMLPPTDEKLRVLQSLLSARPATARTIVFTEFRDTARYLWTVLRKRFPVGLVDGSGAWLGELRSSRRTVVERFAPSANRTAVHAREEIRILIATDVLAEGMNLQDADMVISYDLPWNPIRLIQRIGRVDRMGSNHRTCYSSNFIPDHEFDAFLGLVRTIRHKLETVRGAIGLEHAVLTPSDDFESVIQAVRSADSRLLMDLEKSDSTTASSPAQTVPGIDGVPIGVLSEQWHRLLIGVRRGRNCSLHFARRNGHVSDAGPQGEEVLQRALRDEAIRQPALCCLEAAERAAQALLSSTFALPLPVGSAAARIARALRHELGRTPLMEDAVLDRADRALTSLAGASTLMDEEGFEEILRGSWCSVADLVSAIERTLTSTPRKSPEIRVVGVLVVD